MQLGETVSPVQMRPSPGSRVPSPLALGHRPTPPPPPPRAEAAPGHLAESPSPSDPRTRYPAWSRGSEGQEGREVKGLTLGDVRGPPDNHTGAGRGCGGPSRNAGRQEGLPHTSRGNHALLYDTRWGGALSTPSNPDPEHCQPEAHRSPGVNRGFPDLPRGSGAPRAAPRTQENLTDEITGFL